MAVTSTFAEPPASATDVPDAVSRLTRSLAYTDPAVREQAARDLAGFGTDAVAPLLTYGLRDSDRRVRTAAALSLISLAPGCEIPSRDDPPTDLEAELLEAVIRARFQGDDGIAALKTALDQRDCKRRDAAFRVIEVLVKQLPDESQRRPYVDLLITLIGHKHSRVRLSALKLMQTGPLPGALPALLVRLGKVRRVDSDVVGTLTNGIFYVFWAIGVWRILMPLASPGELPNSLRLLNLALLGLLMLISPLSIAYRLRRKWLASSAELLATLRALDCQELASADPALKDLKSIASSASGHSVEARSHARELIQRVEAAKDHHGPLPIPATALGVEIDTLPVSGSSD